MGHEPVQVSKMPDASGIQPPQSSNQLHELFELIRAKTATDAQLSCMASAKLHQLPDEQLYEYMYTGPCRYAFDGKDS